LVMSWIFTGLVAVAFAAAVLTGRGSELAAAVPQGAQAGITLALSMAGAFCLWSGVGKLMEKAGFTGFLARLFMPLLRRVFPSVKNDPLLAGDLNNQIMASSFAARALGIPFLGLYGACSTFIQAIVLGATLVSGGFLDNALCCASSHFCTAERQFRFPLELGTQRPPAAQWTATAAGAMLLDAKKDPSV